MNERYRVLVLSSVPGATAEIEAAVSRHIHAPRVIYWEMGNATTRPEVYAAIEACAYNLVISYVSGVILRPPHLRKATYGAINIHPAPPEHGGCWGQWCQPVIRRGMRTHHGVTVHEIDEIIDHGPIYRAERWEVPADASIEDVFLRSITDSRRLLDWVCSTIAQGTTGTRCFSPSGDRWDPHNRHTPLPEIRRWFAELDPAHPAHRERIFFNHPRAIMQPPYFDDLQSAPGA